MTVLVCSLKEKEDWSAPFCCNPTRCFERISERPLRFLFRSWIEGEVIFLPPSPDAKLQPLVQETIRAFKLQYCLRPSLYDCSHDWSFQFIRTCSENHHTWHIPRSSLKKCRRVLFLTLQLCGRHPSDVILNARDTKQDCARKESWDVHGSNLSRNTRCRASDWPIILQYNNWKKLRPQPFSSSLVHYSRLSSLTLNNVFISYTSLKNITNHQQREQHSLLKRFMWRYKTWLLWLISPVSSAWWVYETI